MGKNINTQQWSPRSNAFLPTIALAVSMLFPTLKAWASEIIKSNNQTNSEIFENMKNQKKSGSTLYTNFNTIDKDSIALQYIQNNLYIKGTPITDPKLNSNISKYWENKYKITYNHEFEWLPNFSEPSTQTIEIILNFTYKDNNIYINFDGIQIWKYQLTDFGTITLNNTVYDYNVIEWKNKTLDIRTKVNEHKTESLIRKKISETPFFMTKNFFDEKLLEKTQLTSLNKINLWKEIVKDGESYYREVYLIENWKYRPICKIYFNNKWEFDNQKTFEEKRKTNLKILWIDINFELSMSTNNVLVFKISDESRQQLIDKVKSDREKIIKIIDKAKVWPNKDFTWFNKKDEARVRSEWKNVWLFDTKLISLQLIDDTYLFQRWEKEDQVLRFSVTQDKISLKDWNNKDVNITYVTIWKDYYKIELKWETLSIDKIKKEWENMTEHLPTFSWDKEIIPNLTNKNTHFDWNNLWYFNNQWSMTTSIKAKKDEKWYYNLEKQSTNINIVELYNFKQFANLRNQINTLENNQNLLDIDIISSFEKLLQKEWINLKNQDLIRIVGENWEVYYCTISKNFEVKLDKKLYEKVEKVLNTIKDRLEIINNIYNWKIQRVNWSNRQDFEKFVWWWRWIWKKFISQNEITKFLSWESNSLSIDLLWWENNQKTTIIYDINKWCWKKQVEIAWQKYDLKIEKDWTISLDPIEK